MSLLQRTLSEKLVKKVVRTLNIKEFTLVQKMAIPEILRGNNVLIISPTGTGKTEAALLPILEGLLKEPRWGIRALYITPLRALNRDIFRRMAKLSKEVGLKIEVRHGDTSQALRRKQAREPPDILITTPETLQAILPGRVLKEHLRNVQYVVIDEIHEIIDEKRGTQLFLALERLRSLTISDFQRIGLSATVGKPYLVARYLQGSSQRPMKIINARMIRKYEVIVDYPTPTSRDTGLSIKMKLPEEVIARLHEVVEDIKKHNAVLVFTNTRETAELLASRIKILSPDLNIAVHHGSLSREERVYAEEGLKHRKLKALICTSSLELGIDIGSVDYIVQYSSPRRATALLQRIGRSGHRISGIARGKIIALSSDEILESAVLSRMALKGELEEIKVHENALDVLAHQIAGLVLDRGEITLEEAFKLIKSSMPYRGLNPDLFLQTIKFLADERILGLNGSVVHKTRKTWRYYYENLSTIPDVMSYDVVDITSDTRIGSLDEEFIASYGNEGQDFILGGKVWRILNIDHERREVEVEPSSNIEAAVPAWVGELIPVPFRCALEVGSLRRRIALAILKGKDPSQLLRKYEITERAQFKVIEEIKSALKKKYPIPSDKLLVIESVNNIVIVHVPLGSRGAYTLGLILAHVLSRKLSSTVIFRADPYRIALKATIKLLPKDIKSVLEELKESDIREIVRDAVIGTELFKWRLFHVAKRFGLISRDANITILSRRLIEALRGSVVYLETLREIETEKLDLDAITWLLNRLNRKLMDIGIVINKKGECSPFALPILQHYFYDIIPSTRPLESIIEVTKRRLLDREVILSCLYCMRWRERRTIRYLPDRVKCPFCGSRFIVALPPGSEEEKVLNMIKVRRKLNKNEKKLLRRIQRRAALVLNYGKKAIIALAAKGIGPETAVRVLRETMDKGEREFYLKILEAERQYIRTRKFWA